jgi:hypothetical protein
MSNCFNSHSIVLYPPCQRLVLPIIDTIDLVKDNVSDTRLNIVLTKAILVHWH